MRANESQFNSQQMAVNSKMSLFGVLIVNCPITIKNAKFKTKDNLRRFYDVRCHSKGMKEVCDLKMVPL